MEELAKDVIYDVKKVVNQSVGSSKQFCMGYMNPGAPSGQGYISTMKLSVGAVDVNVNDLDDVTETIVSYDRCEKNDAYIGQINMLTVSSFCGLNGALWGYDVATHDDIASGNIKPEYIQAQPDGYDAPDVPVYSVWPLLDATERLFGTEEKRRFPPMPGAHVICANKYFKARGPVWIWSAIGIAILKDRNQGSSLFIEDANIFGNGDTTESELSEFLDNTMRKITKSVVLCGQNQSVVYDKIFVGYKYKFIKEGQVGCSLSCAPYIYLAQNAVPDGVMPSDLTDMTLSQWEEKLGLKPL